MNKKRIIKIAVVAVIVAGLAGGGGFFLWNAIGGSDYEEEYVDISVPHFTIIPAPPGVEVVE